MGYNGMTWTQKLFSTQAPSGVILIRIVLGGIFISEGIQKFLFPDSLGVGRFARIGIPAPAFFGPFVGGCELLCGALILAGLLTRLACCSLLISMSVAIVSTKLPILLGHPIWSFSLAKLPQYGIWSALHEARVDLAMIFCLMFLLIVGAGPWSGDSRLLANKHSGSSSKA